MKKEIVELKLDYMQGPIWISDVETGESFTGIDIVDNNIDIRKLNYKVYKLYDTFFEYNEFGIPTNKKVDVIKQNKIQILDLIKELINKLNEINDGSFEIIDNVTKYISELC